MNDTFYKYVTGQHKNKAGLRQTRVLLPICINTHGQYTTPTCPKCAYKLLQIFLRVFEFALAEFARNSRKIMYHKYFHFYSMSQYQVCIIAGQNAFRFFFLLLTKHLVRWKPEQHYCSSRCSVESQKGANAVQSGHSALLVLNGTSLNCNNALLALNWW